MSLSPQDTTDGVTLELSGDVYMFGAYSGRPHISRLVFTSEEQLCISMGCFSDMPDLKSVVFRGPVGEISKDSFCRNPQLELIKFCDEIEKIRLAFNSNPRLHVITWPSPKDPEPPTNPVTRRGRASNTPVRFVIGFNGCPALPLDQIPTGLAQVIGGFRLDYDRAAVPVPEGLTVNNDNGQSALPLGLTPAQLEYAISVGTEATIKMADIGRLLSDLP